MVRGRVSRFTRMRLAGTNGERGTRQHSRGDRCLAVGGRPKSRGEDDRQLADRRGDLTQLCAGANGLSGPIIRHALSSTKSGICMAHQTVADLRPWEVWPTFPDAM